MTANNNAWHSAKAKLMQERASFTGNPKRKPSRLTIAEIEEEADFFQPRLNAGVEATSVSHIDNLLKALSQDEAVGLGELTVWWSGRRYVLVDGHHRLAAYRQYSETARGIERGGVAKITVAVECLTGTLKEARDASFKGNSRDKLAMSKEAKVEGAWRVVCDDDGTSKPEIAGMCGCSERLVANMRAARGKLIAGGADSKRMTAKRIAGLSWFDARRMAEGGHEEREYDAWAVSEAVAKDWAMRFGKTFADKPTKAPETFARAISIYSPAIRMRMIEAWINSDDSMADQLRALLDGDAQGEFDGDDDGDGDF